MHLLVQYLFPGLCTLNAQLSFRVMQSRLSKRTT